MRDELVHFQFALQIVIHKVRELTAALDSSEGATFPYAPGDELESCEMAISGVFGYRKIL